MGNVTIMETKNQAVNTGGRWVGLQNIMLCARALDRCINREPNLPGIASFTGPSGYGKSMAASYCANKFRGFYVECRSYFTRKSFAEAILNEMGIRPARTLATMMQQAADQLDLSGRPLIIDEADYLVDNKAINLLRDLHEAGRTSILLIGEEDLPNKLRRLERFHNRVLVWELAQPSNTDDTRKLAGHYCPGITVGDDLLARVREVSRGVARRICVNLDMIRNHCETAGLKKIGLEDWGKRALYSGDAPARRQA
jgi:hypothetical protein